MSAPVLVRVEITCFWCQGTGKARPDRLDLCDDDRDDKALPPCAICGGLGRPWVLTDMSGKLHFKGIVPATQHEMESLASRFQ